MIMVKKKTRLPYVALAFAGFAFLLSAVGLKYLQNRSGEENQWGGMPPTPVVTFTVAPREFANSVEAIGTARANESVEIMARVTDTVSRIAFEDSQNVEVGDILVELTDEEEGAALAEARAGLAEAHKQYKRIEDLVANGTATQSRLDTAISERDRSGSRVKALEAKMADRIIRAPFSGVLGLREVSVGSLARPGDLITTLDDVSVIKVDFSVSERYLAKIAPGQTITASSVAWPGVAFIGEVRSVDSRIDPVTRAVMIRAHMPNPETMLKPGMLLSIELIMDRHEALAVPEGALVPVKDTVSVWIVGAENQAAKRAVVTGLRIKGQVEILSGLAEGDKVIVEGVHNIRRPGQKVQPRGEGKPPAVSMNGKRRGRT